MRPLLLIASAATLLAGPPVIQDLQPRGAQKGRPFTLTLAGRELADIVKVHSTMPATFTPLTADKPANVTMGAEGRYASFLVEPKADLTVGVYPIRVETADGISNIQLFAVGSFPEMPEEESLPGSLPNRNDTVETAQSLPNAAVTLNGTLRGPERDLYRLQVKAGEKRVFEIEGRRVGSAIDPVIRLLDGTGRQLARSEDSPLLGLDTRLEHTFAKEGYYYVEVTDARFSAQGANFYRLKTGSYTYPTEVFPLGGRRGEIVEVSLGGTKKATADLRNVSAKLPTTFINLPDPAALPLPFDLGAYPEVTEPTKPLDLPITINGRLSKAAEVDRFTLNVKPGDDIILDVSARELGTSKIMAVLTVTDDKGKRIVRSGDEPLPEELYAVTNSKTVGDPYAAFQVPEGVKQITVTVEDLALRGGPQYAYRVSARRESHAFTANIGTPYINIPAGGTVVVPVAVNRKGYQGDVKLRVVDPPKGLIVEGGYIPPENTNYIQGNRGQIRRGVLLLSAEPGVKIAPTELTIEAIGWLPNGTILSQRATGPGMLVNVAGATIQGALDRQRPVSASWLGLELPAAGTRPLPAALSIKLEKTTRKDTGDEFLFRWKWNARGVQVPENVGIEMVGGADIRAIEMHADPKDRTTGTFLLTTTRLTLPGRYDFFINGRVTVEGQPEDVYSRPLTLVIEAPKEDQKETLSASAGSR